MQASDAHEVFALNMLGAVGGIVGAVGTSVTVILGILQFRRSTLSKSIRFRTNDVEIGSARYEEFP